MTTTATTTARRSRRTVLGLIVAFGVALSSALAGGVVTAPGAQASGAETSFIAKINSARAAAGRRGYAVSSDLTAVARSWAASMAGSGTLRHNPRLTTQVHGWRYVGENVGVGYDVAGLHQAFMNSPAHRANILDTDYTQVGVGVVVSGGRMWVAEVFREPTGSTAASVVKPTTTKAKATVVRYGSRGATVRKLQRRVGVQADGIFGKRTLAALKKWQKRHHLRPTGYLDAATRRAMRI